MSDLPDFNAVSGFSKIAGKTMEKIFGGRKKPKTVAKFYTDTKKKKKRRKKK